MFGSAPTLHTARNRLSRTPSSAPAPLHMIRIQLAVRLDYDVESAGADFVFNIHAAQTGQQTVSDEQLTVTQPAPIVLHTDDVTGNRYLRLHARRGRLSVAYRARVDIRHHSAAPPTLMEAPIRLLPLDVLRYVHPSRYCQSDRLLRFASNTFGGIPPGHARAQAIRDWVFAHIAFTPSTSNSSTSALDTLIQQEGVCRDFAHVMIALCRALNLPARFVSGTDYGANPALGPSDFHAYVEVFLGDRWYLFDPSGTSIPMGLVRLGTGRDAADVAVATIFGSVHSSAPVISAQAVLDPAMGFVQPMHVNEALSTEPAMWVSPSRAVSFRSGAPAPDVRYRTDARDGVA